MSVTLEEVTNALHELGGEAQWNEILTRTTANRNGDYSDYLNWENYQKTAFQHIQQHCQGYKKYKGPAYFMKLTNGRFRLIG